MPPDEILFEADVFVILLVFVLFYEVEEGDYHEGLRAVVEL